MYRFLLVAFLLPLFSSAQTPSFNITVNIKGIAENTRISVTDANNPTDTLAKATVKTGKAVLKGHVAEPNLYHVNLSAAQKVMLFLGNDNVQLTGDVADLKAVSVTGSASHQDFTSFQEKFNPYFGQLNAMRQQTEGGGQNMNRDSLAKVYMGIVAQVQSTVDDFLATHKSSYVSPFVLVVVSQLSDDVFVLEKRFQSLDPQVQKGFYGKYIADLIETGKIGAIGSDAIDFTQTDTTGKPVTLSSFKGKYVLVDFWASWCKPCRMENPNVVATYSRFKDKNFTVLGVSLDKAREPWLKAIHDDNLSWAQVSDLKFWNNEVAVKYRIQQIPQNFLIDPNGKIVGKNLRGPELEAKLCELIGCN